MSKRWEISRRHLLRGSGLTLALPFLEAMVPWVKRAQAAGAPASPPRFFAGFFPMGWGLEQHEFFPDRHGADYLQGRVPYALDPLRHHADRVWILDNLEISRALINASTIPNKFHGGSSASFMTCQSILANYSAQASWKSVDEMIRASRVGDHRYNPLRIAAYQAGHPQGHMTAVSWIKPTQAASFQQASADIFRGLVKVQDERLRSRTSGGLSPEAIEQLKVIDAVRADAMSLNKNLGKNDSLKLQEYLSSIDDLQRAINAPKLPPAETCPGALSEPATVIDRFRKLIDLCVLAFECDLNRSIVFVLDGELSHQPMSHVRFEEAPGRLAPVTDKYHYISHVTLLGNEAANPDFQRAGSTEMKKLKMKAIKRWEMSVFAYYLERMKSKTEGGVPLLHNTLSVFGSGMANSDSHSHQRIPLLLVPPQGVVAGPARFVDCGNRNSGPKAPLANFWRWVLTHYGADDPRFGDSTGILRL